ncbi:MAG: right-handed parallel beta-helix repeat-containing protein [Myxococcota bacterium]
MIVLLGALATSWAWSAPAFAGDGVLEINQTCAVQTGCFAGDAAGLPITIDGSAGRSYRLTSDLVIPNQFTDGIVVSTDNVSIDLAGFEIRGPVVCSGTPLACTPNSGGGSGVGVTSTALSGISVRNGSVRGLGFYGVHLGVQSEVTNVRARSNRSSGIDVGTGSTVSGNTTHQNFGGGIVAGSGSSVSNNAVYQNAGSGIFTLEGSIVSGNTANQNDSQGIVAGAGSTVSGNAAHQNGSAGILAFDGSTVSGNTVRSNTGVGLSLGPQSGYRENVISNNTEGTVTGIGLVNLGNNACNGSTTCP